MKLIINCVTLILSLISVYFFFLFVSFEPYPSEWSPFTRFLGLVIALIVWVLMKPDED